MIATVLLLVLGQDYPPIPDDYLSYVRRVLAKYGQEYPDVVRYAPCYLGRKPWPPQMVQRMGDPRPKVYWDQYVKTAQTMIEKKDSNEKATLSEMKRTLEVTDEELAQQKALVDKMNRSQINRYLNTAYKDIGKVGQFRSEADKSKRIAFEKRMLEDAKVANTESKNRKEMAKNEPEPKKQPDEITVKFQPKTLEEYRMAAEIATHWYQWGIDTPAASLALRSELLENTQLKRKEYRDAMARGVK